jgi:hypothetical protein
MNIFKILMVTLMLGAIAKAETQLPKEEIESYEDDLIMTLCRSADHRLDSNSNACVYCAHGFRYDPSNQRCTGTSSIRGKCDGADHYRAKTHECVYCVSGCAFNEDPDIRECEPVKEQESKKEAKSAL